MKKTKTISLTPDTDERIRKIAEIRHTTVSQLITDWTWQTKLPEERAAPVQAMPILYPER